MIVLKNRVILKNSAVAGTISYNYEEMFGKMGITEFTKQDVINYINSTKIFALYIAILIIIFIYSFIMYLLTTISNIVFLSIFGYFTTLLVKIKMRYVAIFNMSVYAFTLSIILNMLYVAINIVFKFNIEYFQIMYMAVAAIYLVAAIFLLKADVLKKQGELIKIIEAQAIVKKEIQEEKEQKEKEVKKENKKTDEEDKQEDEKKDKTEDNNIGEEPESSNA